MKKKKWQLIISFIIVFGIGYAIDYYLCIEESVLIPLTGALITLFVGLFNFEIANDKLFKELFQEFNNKYDSKFNNRLNQIIDNKEFDEIKDKPLIVDYLNFCAEEYLWHSKGRIEPKVWKNWKNGMDYFMKNEHFRKIAWSEINNNNDSYYDFFKKEFPKLIEEAKNNH